MRVLADAAPATAEAIEILPPEQRIAADDREAVVAVKEANRQGSAAEAVAALDRFEQARALEDDAVRLIEEARADLAPHVAAGRVRSGKDWVRPADRNSRRRRAAEAVRAGVLSLEVGNLAAARMQFEEAASSDPDGILGDLWLGTGYTLAGPLWDAAAARGAAIAGARKHFREALGRRPDHVAALNNLALAEWKAGDVRSALRSWKKAAEAAPGSPQLVQNVGRANMLIGTGLAGAVSRRESRGLADLYADLAAAGGRHTATVGWLVMPPVDSLAIHLDRTGVAFDPAGEFNRPGDAGGEGDSDELGGFGPIDVAFGSGFCVAPGYVLTNRHVALPGGEAGEPDFGRRYDRLAVSAGGVEFEADLIALSSDRDLALLYAPGLNARPVPLAANPPRLAEDVLALGYPRPGVLGGGLKTTRGVVAGLPAGQADGMLLFDAAVNPGNSGGPVCTAGGAVAAVASKIFLLDQGLSAGVTASDADRFLRAALPAADRAGLPPRVSPGATAGGGDWADVAEAVGGSVVQVLCGLRPDRADSGFADSSEFAGPSGPGGEGWEDRSCPVCLGGGEHGCPRDNCVKGKIQVKREVQVGYNRLAKRPIMATKSFPEPCQTCRGTDFVPCGHCVARNGVDPALKWWKPRIEAR